MTYRVQPKEYHCGYCPCICDTEESALKELALMQKYTDFEWEIVEEMDDDEDDEVEEECQDDDGEPDYVLKSESCTQLYDTYEKAREGFSIYHDYYVREGWGVLCEHESKRAIVVDGADVRAMRNVYRKNGRTVELCLSIRIEIE